MAWAASCRGIYDRDQSRHVANVVTMRLLSLLMRTALFLFLDTSLKTAAINPEHDFLAIHVLIVGLAKVRLVYACDDDLHVSQRFQATTVYSSSLYNVLHLKRCRRRR